MSITRDVREWESTDPQYKWTIQASTTDSRLIIYSDDAPTPEGARAFAEALIAAAEWRETRP